MALKKAKLSIIDERKEILASKMLRKSKQERNISHDAKFSSDSDGSLENVSTKHTK